MAKTYQAQNFTGQQLDDFVGKYLDGTLAGTGLSLDEQGVMHNTSRECNKLIYSYTHTGNQEVHPTAVDIATGVFTAQGHGLTANQEVFVAVHPPYHIGTPYDCLPGGLEMIGTKTKGYFVNVIDENTFSLSATSGAEAMTYTEVSTMDLSQFHFEGREWNNFYIGDFPQSDAYHMIIKGRVSNSYRYIHPSNRVYYATKTGGKGYDGAYVDTYGSVHLGENGGWGYIKADVYFEFLEPRHVFQITETDTVAYDNTNWPTYTHARAYNHWRLDSDSIVSFYFGHGGQFYNGTTIEIYAR
ncbi:MAG: hypothetical protein IJW70_06840 [Clostridia bacterium]|nr:hypothetical protein [Clostridia bacterium]